MMTSISAETVDQIAAWLSSLEEEEEVEQLIDDIAEAQPFIFAYLMAMGEGDFSEDERELMLFLGIGVYQMVKQGEAHIPPVTEDHLDRLEQSNMRMLEHLADESEAELMQVIRSLLVDYPQPEVLRYVIETIFEEDAEVLRPANQGIMLTFVKIVIDCLHEAAQTVEG
jgi:hypothetical protein